MISSRDFYHVMTSITPLYVSMLLAYSSVKWWKVFSPEQCSGINRFVALFAVPLLSFHFISLNNPFKMSLRFIAADSLQKLLILLLLALFAALSRRSSLDLTITFFSLSTLPNTLVMGIPLLKGMYGDFSASLMVQVVVLQCIVWYTLLLVMFEYRGARILIGERFPGRAGSIVSIAVDSDVMSLDGRGVEAEAEEMGGGRMHVVVRRSSAERSERLSSLTNAEIYSMQSDSRNPTPRGSSFNNADVGRGLHYQMAAAAKKDLHMFVWSSGASPVSEVFAGGGGKEVRLAVSPPEGKEV